MKIWHFCANETEGFRYFKFRAVAAPLLELSEILEDVWTEE